jgi:hypothetical protein
LVAKIKGIFDWGKLAPVDGTIQMTESMLGLDLDCPDGKLDSKASDLGDYGVRGTGVAQGEDCRRGQSGNLVFCCEAHKGMIFEDDPMFDKTLTIDETKRIESQDNSKLFVGLTEGLTMVKQNSRFSDCSNISGVPSQYVIPPNKTPK